METKRPLLLIALAVIAALQSAPAFAVGSLERDQGYLTDNERQSIRSMQEMMSERPEAQYAIGRIYERGGLDREARNWIHKSALAGYPQAKLWMAEQQMKAAWASGNKGHMLVSSRRSLERR